MYKFSMAMGITLLNRIALSAMTLAQVAGEWEVQVHNMVHLNNNGRGWNGMFHKK
jgi:hypothetical protein